MSVIMPQKILYELNRARTKPQEYAQLVQNQINSFVDQWKMPLMPNCYYKTNEGIGAWKEALQFLLNQKPLHPFQLNEGLNLAAYDHVTDLAAHNMFGHNGSQGSTLTSRIQKRCGKFYGGWGQCIGSVFSQSKDDKAEATVLGLIIDDGVANRGHRNAVFSKQYRFIGAQSRLSDGKIITVIDYHTQNLKAINKQVQTLDQPPHKSSSKSKQSTNMTKVIKKIQNSSEKKVVSSSTNTKTTTTNGKTKKVVTKKFVYSDGSTEEVVEETYT